MKLIGKQTNTFLEFLKQYETSLEKWKELRYSHLTIFDHFSKIK